MPGSLFYIFTKGVITPALALVDEIFGFSVTMKGKPSQEHFTKVLRRVFKDRIIDPSDRGGFHSEHLIRGNEFSDCIINLG